MTSYTVTATNGTGSDGTAVQVEVITGAVETGGASANIGNNGVSPGYAAITPNYSSSFIAWAYNHAAGSTPTLTAETGNSFLTAAAHASQFEDTADGCTYAAGYYSGAITAATPVNAGCADNTGTTVCLAAYEIQPSGSWAEDASTPAYAHSTTTSITTASFTPPAAAVLVACVSGNVASSGAGSSLTVASTPSLTWTLRSYNTDTGSNGLTAVYTATVPGTAAGPVLPLPLQLPQLPPGWFPGADRVTTQPGGIPFFQAPVPVTDPGAVIVPPTPQAAGYRAPLLPPGWFPGSDGAAEQPDGIPFAKTPALADPSQAILPPPAPDPIGIPDWLPFPPLWFPGADKQTAAPADIPFYVQPQPDSSPALPVAAMPPVITGLGAGGQYFTDQNGTPRLALFDNPWALIFNAGQWNGGNWQADMSAYLASRAAQGFTALYLSALGNTDNGGNFQNGNTWDNVPPFVSGINPSSGLNPAYWQRVDYLISVAALHGLTVFLNIAYTQNAGGGNFSTGGALYNLTQQQYTDYGTAVGLRYRSSPNLVWVYGNDYFAGAFDTQFGYIRSAIIAAGDTHVMSVHVYPESTDRYDIQTGLGGGTSGSAFAASNAQFNWVYTYNITYWGIELAYEEAAYYSIPQLGAIWGDGYFYDSGASLPTDQMMRQFAWWAVSSGARGLNTGSNDIQFWGSGSLAAVTAGLWYTAEAGILASALSALPGWHTLMPDTASTLVTAGRGTHGSGIADGQNYAGGTDNYVTASVTPGGTLAVIYCAKAFSITINQSVMVPGYTATWLDPTNGATTTATPGSTYNSGALGNNSQGEPDWVLILQGTAPAAPSGVLVAAAPVPPAPAPAIAPQVIGALAAGPSAVTLADAAGAAEALTVTVTVTLADEGAAVDDQPGELAVSVTLALADAGAAADASAAVTLSSQPVLVQAPPLYPGPPLAPPAQVITALTQAPVAITPGGRGGRGRRHRCHGHRAARRGRRGRRRHHGGGHRPAGRRGSRG